MSYLICCSGSKNTPTLNAGDRENLLFNNELSAARNILIQAYEEERNVQLDWNCTSHAWKLYSGNRSKLYNQVAQANWLNPNTDVKILSALFGWVNHTDLLPLYNLTMGDKLTLNGRSQSIERYWRNTGLLLPLINPDDTDLLFNKYRKAIHGNNNPVATPPPGVIFTGRGKQQGAWLNANL